MDLLNLLSIELCDSVLCCSTWYTDGKPPESPSPTGVHEGFEKEDSGNWQSLAGDVEYTSRSRPLSIHSSVERTDEQPKDDRPKWEQCDIRRPLKEQPTLKELAEQYIAQQRTEEAIRLAFEKEKESVLSAEVMRKEQSFVTTDGDDDSMDLRASSFCSVISSNNIQMTKKDISSRENSGDELELEVYHDQYHEQEVRPGSKLETDSKDSGYGAEIHNRSKRKLVKFPNQHSLENDRTSTSPLPYECPPHDYLEPEEERPHTSCSLPPEDTNNSLKCKKKGGLFASFRLSKSKGSGKESEEDQSASSSKKKRKKKGKQSNLQVAPRQSFVLRGKRGDSAARPPGHSFESEDM